MGGLMRREQRTRRLRGRCRHRRGPLLERPGSARADESLPQRGLLPRGLSVRRGVLDFRIQLGARENGKTRDVEPQHENDHASDRPVGRVVVGEAGDIELEDERRDEPQHGRGNGSRCDPHQS